MNTKFKALLTILALVGCYFALAFFMFPGLFPPFYYAEYNQVRERLEAIPGVEIIDDWQHHDITLEDCDFVVRVGGLDPVMIEFYDGDDWEVPFEKLDGLIVALPRNPQSGHVERTTVGVHELKDAGVRVNNLRGALLNIDKVLSIARSRPTMSQGDDPPGVWVWIFRDLDRFKGDLGEEGDVGPAL